ncbi:MAG: hypothetical protein Q9169_004293 [Polycauliona sp. 2 TL-2023]
MVGRLFVRLADRLSHRGETPSAREARHEADFEAEFRPKWEAWKQMHSCQDKWDTFSSPEGYAFECPVDDLIYPQGSGAVETPILDSWLIGPPWSRAAWFGPLHQRLLEIISEEYNDPASPAREDADSLNLDEREYGYYMAKEHLRAREYGRRSRLDDVCGEKADDDYDWDTMGPRGLTYDESWDMDDE